jgi:DNA polymerase III epsilon subunit-like protein
VNYLLVDTETVGLNPPKHGSGVVQIAWLELDMWGDVVDEHCHLINPEAPIHPEASKVHGILDADVVNSPKLSEVFNPQGPSIQISHNAVFDLRFVADRYENLKGSICTLNLARQFLPNAPNHKLATLVEFLGLSDYKAHDALGDVKATQELLKILMDITGKDLEALAAFCAVPKVVYTMPFGKFKGQPINQLPISYIRYFEDKDIDDNLRLAFDQQMKIRG